MPARAAAAWAAVLLLVAGCGSSSNLDLDAAKAAFARHGIHFGPTVGHDQLEALKSSSLGSDIPKRSIDRMGSETLISGGGHLGFVLVLDDASTAASLAAHFRHGASAAHQLVAVLAARNVVYLGTNDVAARRAMADLRKK